MPEIWTTDRRVTFVRNAERISGFGYSIWTDVVDVAQDGETRRMMRVSGTVGNSPIPAEVYVPEGACGIRIDATERVRRACLATIEAPKTCPRCISARERVAATGCRVSAVPDHGEAFCAAQSIELAGPGTYGAARVYIQVRA